MSNDNRPIMVTIRCLAYNQENYIRQCLDGFVMQKTNFRFEAIVHDDASTDGTADIIREYAEKYPDIIKPIIEEENLYSKHDGSLRIIMDKHMHGKYIALCEGDDYWTDPLKLQKQYDFMEAHPECSLCFHAHQDLYPDGRITSVVPNESVEFYYPKQIIRISDNIIGTNTIFYRHCFLQKEGRPKFWKACPVGDIPLRLYFASKGSVGYINEIMSVYRKFSQGSWTSKKKSLKDRITHHLKIIKTYRLYDDYTNKKFHWTLSLEIFKIEYTILRDSISCAIKSIIKIVRL